MDRPDPPGPSGLCTLAKLILDINAYLMASKPAETAAAPGAAVPKSQAGPANDGTSDRGGPGRRDGSQ